MGVLNRIKKTISNAFSKKAYYQSNSQSITSLLRNDAVLDLNTYYDLYEYNGDIRQAVKQIAKGVSRNGLYLEDNNRKVIESNVLTDEVYSLFQTPTFLHFKTALYRNYFLSGELYIIPILNIQGQTIGFEVLDSRAVSKYVDEYGVIQYFQVTNNAGQTQRYLPDQLAYFKYEDSVHNSVNGMGVLNGVVYDALSDLEAMRTNYYFYQNSAIPSAILILDEGMSPEEMQNAKDMFEHQFRGTKNQHKTLVAGGVKDIKTIALSPRDMEFINQRHLTTEKVSACFGVPKAMLGYVEDVNYSNGQNQRTVFIEGTLRPLETDFEHILNRLLEMFRPDLFEKLRVRADGEQVEATQERLEGLRKDVASGIITINEARIERGFEAMPDENADKLIVSRNAVLLEDIALDPVLYSDET